MPLPLAQHEPWYVHAFGELYPQLYRHRDAAAAQQEIDALLAWLALPTGARVVDICCGAGRHMCALRRRGVDVVGVDLSEVLLRQAARTADLRGRLIRADVRALPFMAWFDLAVCLFTSFGYFEQDRDNQRQLEQMARVLRPGGMLVMDLVNVPRLRRDFVPYSRDVHDGTVTEHRRRLVGRRVEKDTTVTDAEGRIHRFTESVRLYEADELAPMLAGVGLAAVAFYGSFDGAPYDAHTPRMIVTGRRP